MNFTSRRAFFPLLCAFVSLCEIIAAPEIRHFAPHAVVPGRTTILTFSGSDLVNASNLWTSFGGKAHRVANTNENLISFAVACPPDIHGVQALQLIGADGASNFQLILADALGTESHQDNHQSPSTALRINPPTAVDCILKSEKIDYYTFAGKAGEHYSIEIIAHRIGSQMDPVVRVLDARGEELAYCDDGGGVWKDARFEFTAPSDGDYTLAVQDIGYGGGNAFDYRLRVSHDPLVWFTFPLVDPSEAGATFDRIGSGIKRADFGSPVNPSPTLVLSAIPQIAELEPNDSVPAALPVNPPILLHGRIANGSDIDYFQFRAREDQKLVFQSQTRSLGSPCDLVLRIKNKDGSTVAQSDVGNAADAALTNTFAGEGTYYLEVRELSGNPFPNVSYRIRVRDFAPGFQLSSENNVFNIKSGGTAKLKVTASRFEYDGPIELRFEPELTGVTAENAIIPEKKNEVELTLKASESARPGLFQHVRLVATHSRPSAQVSTLPALRESFPLMLNSPRLLDGIFVIGVRK